MRKLTVKNFSVIKEAELEFGKITVLIGPQSSGKSLLCKLAYFFQKVVIELAEESIRKESSLEGFGQKVSSEFTFNNWFPAFGSEAGTKVTYSDGQFSVSLSRSSSSPGLNRPGMIKGPPATFSVEISDAYSMTLSRLRHEKSSGGTVDYSRYTREIREQLEALQSPDSAIYSYIPSTRSFFTSPQKALISTSQRLDPITVRFSQDFTFNYRERVPQVGLNHDLTTWIDQESRRILKGEVIVRGNTEIFSSDDGRELPLSFLSSGTQELLPLIMCLREFVALSSAVATTLDLKEALHRRLFIVEEPEANDFPSTQYDLVRTFARMANEPILDASWVITTHSPYILSAFNDLIEAGRLGAESDLSAEVNNVVPREFWVKPGDFKAYSIHDGKLESIMDTETGLINGEYLDAISNKIGGDFDALLRIGYAKS
jgi:hypothetical protein